MLFVYLLKANVKILENLTIIIPTLNEEDYIEEAIHSARFANEIIVIDSLSTDRTKEIVEKHDVTFIVKQFEDFSSQRLFAALRATHNMILFIDADERISDSLREEIQDILKSNNILSAYEISFKHFFMGKQIKYGSLKKSWKLRLFNKNLCWYNEKLLVHEKLIVKQGKQGRLKQPILHYTYRSWNHFIQKKQLYAELQAKQLFKKGIKPNIFHFTIKPLHRFLSQYLIKCGFLDGFPGFVSAVINANYVLIRYIKLWLMYHKMI
jgi:glycosyltransferase involved in cell wall biosynthesis